MEKHRRRGVDRSICYQIEVADESYRLLKESIQMFEENREEYRYTKAGVFFALLHLPNQLPTELESFCGLRQVIPNIV